MKVVNRRGLRICSVALFVVSLTIPTTRLMAEPLPNAMQANVEPIVVQNQDRQQTACPDSSSNNGGSELADESNNPIAVVPPSDSQSEPNSADLADVMISSDAADVTNSKQGTVESSTDVGDTFDTSDPSSRSLSPDSSNISSNAISGWHVDSVTGKRCWYENGQMIQNREFYDQKTGSWYFAEADGSIAHGVRWLPSNGGKWVYYDVVTGAMAHGEVNLSYDADHTGWYHFDEYSGAMAHGVTWVASNGGKWVYYDCNTGQMRYGEQYLSYDAEHTGWYYFNAATGAMHYGFMSLPGTEGAHSKAGVRWVYYGPNPGDGKMRHGWQYAEGKAYYFDPVTGHILYGSDPASRIAALCFQQDNFGYGGGWCQAWVAKAYERAGLPSRSRICAWQAMLDWGVSADKDNIPVAATLYGHSSTGSHGDGYADYGHVAIHLPGNLAASLRFGHVDIEPFGAFDATNRFLCWGWNGGDPL